MYTSLRTANLQSSKNLVKIIARYSGPKGVQFHYVSTVSIGNIGTTTLVNSTNITDGTSDISSLYSVPFPSLGTRYY